MAERLTLMGAKHFIDMPKGTIYLRFWEDTEEELFNVIENFKNNKLEIDWENVEIYGNNFGSMAFNYSEEDYIFYYDANVVGDACPANTLYLIIPEDLVPSNIPIRDIDGNEHNISKAEFSKSRKKFIEYFKDCEIDNRLDKENDWARQILNKDYKNNSIVNLIINNEV